MYNQSKFSSGVNIQTKQMYKQNMCTNKINVQSK